MNPKNNKKIYQFGDFVLNARNRNFYNRAELIKLSSRAFDILDYLIEKHGEIVSKDEILETVWNDSFVEEGNLPVHISALRKIFSERADGGSKFIKTVSGRGYSFVVPVREIEKSPKVFNGVSRTENLNQLRSIIKYDASLAVLPFRHSRASEDFDYLSNGITQSLIDQLSQIPGLKVMSFSSVVGYKDSNADLPEIGYLLNVKNFLIGYISEFKDFFEINVELINADDASQVWGRHYDFRLDNFFRIKKEISLNVAEKLKIKLSKPDKTNKKSVAAEKSESYKLYLKGRYLLETYQLSESYRDGLDRALDYFRQSIDEDPNYAPAYVGLARVYHNYNVYSLISREEAYTKYRNYVNLALKLDPNLSDAYVCKGILNLIFQTDLLEAEKSLARAIRLNPNNIRAYNFLSITMTGLSRFNEAIEYQKTALELNPTSNLLSTGLADRLFLMGDYEAAIAQAEESLEFNYRSVQSLIILARSYAALKLFKKAVQNIKKAEEILSSEEVFLLQSYIYHLAGEPETSARLLDKVLSDSANLNVDFTDVARVYAISGEHEKAFDFLEKAYSEGSESIMSLNVDPELAALKKYPKFDALLTKLNIPNSPNTSKINKF